MLNTDTTPACFWITNPTNFYFDNVCAGSEQHGFWFDLQPNPTGPSFTTSVCPQGMPLGAFDRNAAHSTTRRAPPPLFAFLLFTALLRRC